MTREEYVAALRAVADFYEEAEGMGVPHPEAYSDELSVMVPVWGEWRMPDIARALGTAEKHVEDQYFVLRKRLPAGAVLDFYAAREAVCTKRVVGTEKRVEKVATAWEEREVEKEIVEWTCPDSLLGPKAEEELAG